MGDHPPITNMMDESEDSKVSEVTPTGEKCELGMGSYEDPTEPDCNGISHHNQDNDHNNCYVDVNEAVAINDDVVFNKNEVAGSSSVLPESNTMDDDQVPHNEESGGLNWEINKPLNREGNGKVDWADEFPPLVSRKTMKHEGIVNCERKDISIASSEGCSIDSLDGKEASIEAVIKPFNFLIKIPRSDTEVLREQIRLAKLHFDEKTKLRDALQVQIQERRANNGMDYENAKNEIRNARGLVKSKRMEIDSVMSMINRAKTALSIEDMNSRICNINYMMHHNTITLKEEKQLIGEIEQLKQLREQLSATFGSQEEIKQALEQREGAEERLKILREELGILRDKVLKAETAAEKAEKKYQNEVKKVKELQVQLRAAADVRQMAYVQWESLRVELQKKNESFFNYKDDATAAMNFAFSKDTEALYGFCMNQVENFMELWNTKNEFRQDYVKLNESSTTRRFGTLDGRSLGPNEDPLILPSYVPARVGQMVSTPATVDSVSQIPTPKLKQEKAVENVIPDNKIQKKKRRNRNKKVTNTGTTDSLEAQQEDPKKLKGDVELKSMAEELRRKDADDKLKEQRRLEELAKAQEEEMRRKEAEAKLIQQRRLDELAKAQAEEMRRKEAKDKLKEQRRLEELAKANEAHDRKKQEAEEEQMREMKAQKEAEKREKAREKRLRKKERKKAAARDVHDSNNNCEAAASSKNSKELSKDVSPLIPERPRKPQLSTKQSKTKSVHPPLRERKKIYLWMWVGLICLVIFAVLWLRNIGFFRNAGLVN